MIKSPTAPSDAPAFAVAILRDLVGWVRGLMKQPANLPSYTVAQAALLDVNDFYSAAPGNAYSKLIYVTDETGGAVPAFCDGTNFRRVTDRAIIS